MFSSRGFGNAFWVALFIVVLGVNCCSTGMMMEADLAGSPKMNFGSVKANLLKQVRIMGAVCLRSRDRFVEIGSIQEN